jgi:hypothetical protein
MTQHRFAEQGPTRKNEPPPKAAMHAPTHLTEPSEQPEVDKIARCTARSTKFVRRPKNSYYTGTDFSPSATHSSSTVFKAPLATFPSRCARSDTHPSQQHRRPRRVLGGLALGGMTPGSLRNGGDMKRSDGLDSYRYRPRGHDHTTNDAALLPPSPAWMATCVRARCGECMWT